MALATGGRRASLWFVPPVRCSPGRAVVVVVLADSASVAFWVVALACSLRQPYPQPYPHPPPYPYPLGYPYP